MNEFRRCFLKWQFLRLNEEYVKTYKKYEILVNDPRQNTNGHDCIKIALMIRNCFEINFPINPSFNLKIDNPPKKDREMLLMAFRRTKAIYCLTSDYAIVNPGEIDVFKKVYSSKTAKELGIIDQLNIQVDISKPKKQILKEFGDLINKWFEYKNKTINKRFISKYEEYLRIYSYFKEGLSPTAIAKKMHPNEFKKNLRLRRVSPDKSNPTVSKIYMQIKTVDELIKGGYKLL